MGQSLCPDPAVRRTEVSPRRGARRHVVGRATDGRRGGRQSDGGHSFGIVRSGAKRRRLLFRASLLAGAGVSSHAHLRNRPPGFGTVVWLRAKPLRVRRWARNGVRRIAGIAGRQLGCHRLHAGRLGVGSQSEPPLQQTAWRRKLHAGESGNCIQHLLGRLDSRRQRQGDGPHRQGFSHRQRGRLGCHRRPPRPSERDG